MLLIGTVHRDREAGRRLLRVLRRERPQVVVVEMSPLSLAFRRERGKELRAAIAAALGTTPGASRRAAEARELGEVLAVPRELRATLAYARKAGEPRPRIFVADRSRFAAAKLAEIEAWAGEVLARLARGEDPAPFPARRRTPLPPPRPSPESLEKNRLRSAEAHARERFMASVVRRLAASAPPGARVAWVGGFEHLRPIARRLKDLGPRRLRIRASMSAA